MSTGLLMGINIRWWFEAGSIINIQNLILECDFASAMAIVKRNKDPDITCKALLQEIWKLLKDHWSVCVKYYIFIEANIYADWLANEASLRPLVEEVLITIPLGIHELLSIDRRGVSFPKVMLT
ncbi:hypothetical protein Ancab_038481 [Ancistrocladus abbreviatus]